MTTFTIDEQNNITAFGSAEEAAAATATPFDSFASQKQLADLMAAAESLWDPRIKHQEARLDFRFDVSFSNRRVISGRN
jgi:hypothetical protein